MVRLLAVRSDTKSNVKLGGFRARLQVSYASSHNEELLDNEIVCLWMTIYIYLSLRHVLFNMIEHILIKNKL